MSERTADATLDAITLEVDERSYSYRELDERTNQVAHHLHELRVRPEAVAGSPVARRRQWLGDDLRVTCGNVPSNVHGSAVKRMVEVRGDRHLEA